MAILIMKIGERADDHGGRRRPTAALWPHSRRRGTLQSANILRNKFTSLNLESIIVIHTIMAMKGHGALCLTSCYLAKDVRTEPHNDDLYCAQLAQTSIRVSRRRLRFWRSRDELFNKRR